MGSDDEEPARPPPRVKDLAKRFESTTPTLEKRSTPTATKRVGKFRVNEHGQMFRVNNPVVRVGVIRKKSSTRKRSQSVSDMAIKKESSMKKSVTWNPDCRYPGGSAPSSSREATPSRNLPEPGLIHRREAELRPQTPPPPGTPPPQPSPRTRRVKPMPPAKPARLLPPRPPSTTDDEKMDPPRQERDPEEEEEHIVHATPVVIKAGTLPRPRGPPPAPPQPPSRERMNRIPSYLNNSHRTLPRLPRQSSSEDDTYQRLPTPPRSEATKKEQENPKDTVTQPDITSIPTKRDSTTFRTNSEDIPRIPTIPPPEIPRGEMSDDSQCYEEIMQEVRLRPEPHSCSPTACSSTGARSQCSDNMTSDYGSSNYNYVTQIYTRGEEISQSVTSSPTVTNRSKQDQENSPPTLSKRSSMTFTPWNSAASQRPGTRADDDVMNRSISSGTTAEERNFHLGTLARNRKGRRPVSTLELDKLFKFKSDLQLNFTKKMDKLRQKVDRKSTRSTSKFYADPMTLSTDNIKEPEILRRSKEVAGRDPDDDRYIYGDDWSSDDDEDCLYDDRRSSMYKELEEQLNRAFPVKVTESLYECADLPSTMESSSRPTDLPIDKQMITSISVDEPFPDYDYNRQYTSRLPIDQPLYQIYMMEEVEKLVDDVASVTTVEIERPTRETSRPPIEIEEEERTVGIMKSRRESSVSSDSGRGADCTSTSASGLTSNTSMRRDRLVAASHFGSQRSLWCELAEVKSSGLLESLDDDTKLLQEAYFEVITSEASYLRSLNILITHFMASQELLGSKSSLSVIANCDRKHLFSNIFAVRDCSERLLCDLESRLEENLVLDDICDILVQHFESNFDVYVKYCSNQVYQDRTLRRLKTENSGFLTAISRLESDRICQGLDMRSFLMLPMQRITRYPLLMYAILERLSADSPKFTTASKALEASSKVVGECNEGARRMESTEQLLEVDRRLVYKDPEIKRIPLVSNSRQLVKRGTLTQLVERRSKSLLQGRQKARSIHVFLFSDMIMITKKKLNGTYVCKDYAPRQYVDIEPIEPDNPRIPAGAISQLATRPHLFHCVLMRNARGKQTELLLSAESETDRERWLSAIRPPTSHNPEEKVYAEWDCPQAITVHPFRQLQNDELELQIGDVVNILRKMPDGWLYGERIRDGVGGWFPSSYVQQILNDHVRANNYRHRLRLIQAASGITRGTVGRGSTPFLDRLRRMSNPKTYFNNNPQANMGPEPVQGIGL